VSEQDVKRYIEAGKETRHLEYKQSVSWKDTNAKRKITKSILGMSNIKDGGTILIGMQQQRDKSYFPQGVNRDDLSSFENEDEIKDFVSAYADPYVEFDIKIEPYNGKKFVLINVSEFDELPVICKKECSGILRRGALYVRSRRKPETVEVPTEVEMREIINLAIDKGNLKLSKRGYEMSNREADEQFYMHQLKDLES